MNINTIIIHITQDITYYTANYEISPIIVDKVPTYLIYDHNRYTIPHKFRFIDYTKPNLFDYNNFKENLKDESLNKDKTINMFCIFIKMIIENYVCKYEDPNINNIIICLEYDITSKYRELLLKVLNVFKINNMFSVEINKNNNLISNIYIINESLGNCNRILSLLPSTFLKNFKYVINFNLCSDCLEVYVYEINGLNKNAINIQKFYTNNISNNIYKKRIIQYLLENIEYFLPTFHNVQIEKIYYKFIETLTFKPISDITIEIDTDEEVQLIEMDIYELNQELNKIFGNIVDYIKDIKDKLPKEQSFMFFTGKLFNIKNLSDTIINNLDYEFVNMNNKSITTIEGYNLLIKDNININQILFNNTYPNIKLIDDISYDVLNIVDKINIRNKIEKVYNRIYNIINIMMKMNKYEKDIPKLKQELKSLKNIKDRGEMTNSTLNYMLSKLNQYK